MTAELTQEFTLPTSLRDLAFILFKRKWSILTIIGSVVVISAAWIFLVREDAYEVKAKVLVRIGHEQATPPTVLGDRPLSIVGERVEDVNTEADILQSTDLLGKVVDELGLDKPGPEKPIPQALFPKVRHYAKRYVRMFKDWYNDILIRIGFRVRLTEREKAIAMLQKGLLVTPQTESNVIVVRLFLPSRQYGAAILNHLVETYRDFRLGMFRDRSAVEFFEGEVQDSDRALDAAERALHDFEITWNILAVEQQKRVLLEQIADAKSAFAAVEIDYREAAGKASRIDQELAKSEPDFGTLGQFAPESFPSDIMSQLAALQREREQLRMTELDDSARIQNNRRQFHALLDIIGSNMRSVSDEKKAVRDGRKASLDGLERELNGLHEREMAWNDLKRDVKTLETRDIFYKSKLEEARARVTLEAKRIGNVAVVERAMDALKPAGMRKVMLLAIALAVAVTAALAWVAIAEFFDHGIYSAEQLNKRIKAPVLAVIPQVERAWRREPVHRRVVLAGRTWTGGK